MKKIFVIYFVLSLNFIFSQKISLKEIYHKDTLDIENTVKYLAKQLDATYQNNDKANYFDTFFRLSIINRKYDLALSQLDSVRNIYVKTNPALTNSTGSQFEIYINTVKRNPNESEFDKVYEEEFRKKYESLPVRSQLLFPQYFTYDEKGTKKEITEIIKKNIANDSIEMSDAVKLCRRYNTYKVAKKTFVLGNELIRKLEKEKYIVYDSIKITTKDNAVLTLSVVLNNKNKKPGNTILINTIYSDIKNINNAKEFASNGYVGVILNTRGKYLSNSNVEPFEHEADDINEAIKWIIEQPWSNGKIGMIGGSYLGFSQWAATKNLHPALKTIVPEAPVGVGTMDFPMNNNIFTSYALRWLNFVTNTKMSDYENFRNETKWNSIYREWYVSGKAFRKLDSISGKPNVVFQQWLKHPSYDDYWKSMVPYKKEFSKINIPILTITGYYDSDQLGAFYYFRNHYKYNHNANHFLIIGPYDHAGAQGNISNELEGYTIDPVANIDLSKIWIEWFDYILKGKEKPSFLKNLINYQVMGTNEWKTTNSLKKFDENKTKFYLENKDSNHFLSDLHTNNTGFSSLKIDLSNRYDADELLALKNKIVEDKIYTKNSLVFSSKTFDSSFELSGNFSGKLNFSINKKDVDLFAYLYELMPNGKYFLLSTYLGRASYNKNSEKRNLLKPNRKESILFNNNEFVSKKIEKGSKLILVIGTIKTPFYQINYGSGKDVSDETIEDAKEPLEIKWYNDSYIEIPIQKDTKK